MKRNTCMRFYLRCLLIIFQCISPFCFACMLYVSYFMCSGKGKGRGRIRPEDEEELGNARPSAPSTLFDFLESKMGTLSVEGRLNLK